MKYKTTKRQDRFAKGVKNIVTKFVDVKNPKIVKRR